MIYELRCLNSNISMLVTPDEDSLVHDPDDRTTRFYPESGSHLTGWAHGDATANRIMGSPAIFFDIPYPFVFSWDVVASLTPRPDIGLPDVHIQALEGEGYLSPDAIAHATRMAEEVMSDTDDGNA